MTEAQIQKFMSAVESAEIKNFTFVDDITCYYKNGDTGVCVYDSANKAIVSIQSHLPGTAQASNPLKFQMCDIVDIHRAEIQGEYEVIKKFIDAYGLSLDEEQLKVLITIDRNNTIVKPVTGDYTVTYHKLSPEEYNALTEEQKKEYDEKVAKDQARLVDLPKGRAIMQVDDPRYPMLNRNEYLKNN